MLCGRTSKTFESILYLYNEPLPYTPAERAFEKNKALSWHS